MYTSGLDDTIAEITAESSWPHLTKSPERLQRRRVMRVELA